MNDANESPTPGDFSSIFDEVFKGIDLTPKHLKSNTMLSYTRLNEVYNCQYTFIDKKALLGAMFTWIERSIK